MIRMFDKWDRLMITAFSVAVFVSVACFYWFVDSRGFLSFPNQRIEESLGSQSYDYFAYALEYRERRIALALTYRTFLSSFGFLVGMILAAIGGIFILRKAVAEFELRTGNATQGSFLASSASSRSGGGAIDSNNTSLLPGLSASLGTNSPGIVFMIGGVAVIFITQSFAIPVGAPEIFPNSSQIRCSADQERRGTCYIDQKPTPSAIRSPTLLSIQTRCKVSPESFKFCPALNEEIDQ